MLVAEGSRRMLILKRRKRQRIKIGDGWLTVIDIDRNGVRLGFEFPSGVTILREELIPISEGHDGKEETAPVVERDSRS